MKKLTLILLMIISVAYAQISILDNGNAIAVKENADTVITMNKENLVFRSVAPPFCEFMQGGKRVYQFEFQNVTSPSVADAASLVSTVNGYINSAGTFSVDSLISSGGATFGADVTISTNLTADSITADYILSNTDVVGSKNITATDTIKSDRNSDSFLNPTFSMVNSSDGVGDLQFIKRGISYLEIGSSKYNTYTSDNSFFSQSDSTITIENTSGTIDGTAIRFFTSKKCQYELNATFTINNGSCWYGVRFVKADGTFIDHNLSAADDGAFTSYLNPLNYASSGAATVTLHTTFNTENITDDFIAIDFHIGSFSGSASPYITYDLRTIKLQTGHDDWTNSAYTGQGSGTTNFTQTGDTIKTTTIGGTLPGCGVMFNSGEKQQYAINFTGTKSNTSTVWVGVILYKDGATVAYDIPAAKHGAFNLYLSPLNYVQYNSGTTDISISTVIDLRDAPDYDSLFFHVGANGGSSPYVTFNQQDLDLFVLGNDFLIKNNTLDGGVKVLTDKFTEALSIDFRGVVETKKGVKVNQSVVSSDLTLDYDYHKIWVDASSGAVTITLPEITSQWDGTEFIIKAIDVTNTVTIQVSGSDTIDGNSSIVIGSQYDSYTITSNLENNAWYIE